MAEFAPLAISILHDEEYLLLPPDFQHIWLVLCISEMPGKCGIFKGGSVVLSQQSCRPLPVVKDALAAFRELGWLRNDGDYWWIVSRIKHREHNSAWKLAAVKEATSMLDKTVLASECVAKYGMSTGGGANAEGGRGVGRGANKSTAQQRKESKKESAADAAGPTGPQSDAKPLTEAQQKCTPAAGKAIEAINRRCEERGVKPPAGATVKDAAIAFDGLHRNEGIVPREALAALLWLLTDDFWQDLLLSPKQWRDRKKPGAPVKFANAYAKWQQAGRPQPGQMAVIGNGKYSQPDEAGAAARQRLLDEEREEKAHWSRRLAHLASREIYPPGEMNLDQLRCWIAQAEKQEVVR